ncbi:MAG: 16S rRNA (cytosine(967)-C(5))-methyltransferase RsmB [Thermodesulfobacteriota bacterium]
MTSRAIAILCLVEQDKSKEPVDQILATFFEQNPLADDRDRQLTMALIYGVLRHRQELDVLLKTYSKKALSKLNPLVLQALRIGLVQLLFLDRIPESAAVNETVKGLGRQPKWLKGFVNGVLRAVVRDIDGVRQRLNDLPIEKRLNHPEWLVSMWEKQFGRKQALDLCITNNTPPPLGLRLNPHLVSRDVFLKQLKDHNSACPGNFTDHSVLLSDFHGRIDSLPGYDEGLFHVQDEAAQLIASFFTDLPSGAYLDGCAGLGGKTILLDQVLATDATLTAVEPHEGRLGLLQKNLDRCHCRPISLHATTLQKLSEKHPAAFDGILLDAPCSGLGIIRRQPDIRWNRSMADLAKLARTQLALLSSAATLVKPGGVVVYVTCSLSTIENEEVIASFLNGHPQFTIMPPVLSDQAHSLVTNPGFLRTLPSQGLDGFFAARLLMSR